MPSPLIVLKISGYSAVCLKIAAKRLAVIALSLLGACTNLQPAHKADYALLDGHVFGATALPLAPTTSFWQAAVIRVKLNFGKFIRRWP